MTDTPFPGDLAEMAGMALDIHSGNRMQLRAQPPGPPRRMDGYTLGVVELPVSTPQNTFHGGEMHPDGDEFLYLISGRVELHADGCAPRMLNPGQGAVIPKGVWHRLQVLQAGQLIHLTPGPGGEHRPPPA